MRFFFTECTHLAQLGCALLAASAVACGASSAHEASPGAGLDEPVSLVVSSAPPPLPVRVEEQPPAPFSGAVWVPGHWEWQGAEWVWNKGDWEASPSQRVWTPPALVQDEQGALRYYPGYWRPPEVEPAKPYRGPFAGETSVPEARPAPSSEAGRDPM